DFGRSKPMPDLFAISRNALEVQQRHEGFEPRIGWARAVGCSAHLRSPGLAASGVRLRQQRLLVRRLIGDRRCAVGIAGTDEARCRELPKHREIGGEPSLAAAPPPVLFSVATVADAITMLLPGPPSRRSCPPPPISTSSPLPPVSVSLPALPTR